MTPNNPAIKPLVAAIILLLLASCTAQTASFSTRHLSEFQSTMPETAQRLSSDRAKALCRANRLSCSGGVVGYDALVFGRIVILADQEDDLLSIWLLHQSKVVGSIEDVTTPILIEHRYQETGLDGVCEPTKVREYFKFSTENRSVTIVEELDLPKCDGGHILNPKTGLEAGYQALLSQSELYLLTE